MDEIRNYKNLISELCSTHQVAEMFLFGSVANGNLKPESDIDLLVSFGKVKPEDYFLNYLDLKQKLENIFHRKVDLLEEQTIKNPVLKRSIEKNKIRIYG